MISIDLSQQESIIISLDLPEDNENDIENKENAGSNQGNPRLNELQNGKEVEMVQMPCHDKQEHQEACNQQQQKSKSDEDKSSSFELQRLRKMNRNEFNEIL